MKIIKVLLISLVILIVLAAAAITIFISTFDVNRYKPQIISQAKAALNRDMDFGKASLAFSFSKGVSVRITDLAIGEDPAFAKGNFFTVKDISVGVDALGYLSHKKVDISGFSVDAPSVKIIRLKDGSLNVTSLAKSAPAENKGPSVTVPAPASAPAALPAILISSIRVNNGTINYEDRSFEPAMSLEITDVTVSIDHLSMTEPFSFVVEGAVLSAKKNIKIEGRAQFDPKTSEVTVSDFKASTDLSELLLEKIPVVFPMAKGASLPTMLKGRADVTVDKLTAGPQGLKGLTADVALTDGMLQFKELALPVKDVTANIKLTSTKVTIDKASAVIGDGTIKASGTIDDYLTGQNYDMTLNAQNLKLQDFAGQDKAAVKAEGIISADMKVKGAGFTTEAVKSTLSGDGTITGKSIKLKDMNVLRTVLDKISVIPNLSEKVQANLPEKYKEKLTQTDTAISDISLPITIDKGRVVIKDILVSADEFTFKGQAEAGLEGTFSSEGSFMIPADLSASMVAGVSQLQYLLDPDKRIYIPLKVSGTFPKVDFSVDPIYMAGKLIQNQAETQLINAATKALSGKGSGSSASGQPGQAQATGTEEKQATPADLVAGALGSMFKK